MKRLHLTRFGLIAGTIVGGLGLAVLPASALATTTNAKATASTANDQAKVKLIIARGDSEINRRLTTLNGLSSKISGAQKLSSDDQTTLTSEVTGEISDLTSLKTKLDADTDLATTKSDAQSIITDYRVYALVVPKVALVKAADDQQVAENKLTDLSTKLQSRIAAAQKSGKSVTSLQSSLTDLNAKVAAAQAISSSEETNVIGLQPADYNSNHSVLSGDRDQLSTARNDIQAAVSDAKNIVSGLKNL